MLSPIARKLTYLTAVLFVLMGAVLFLAPLWAAPRFAWEISPFVAMTMGGWYLGAAAMAYESARRWDWSVVIGILIFTWAFGLSEGLLLVIHNDVLRVDRALGLPYVLMLVVASINAVVGIASYWRERPRVAAVGLPNPWWSRLMYAGFVFYVGLLVVLLVDGIAPDGKIWPGPLSLLTARAFGAFFGSLVLAAIPLAFARGFAAIEAFDRPGLFMATIIEVAALFYLHLFDFANKPGGLIYHLSYGLAIVGALFLLSYGYLKRRESSAPVASASGGAA